MQTRLLLILLIISIVPCYTFSQNNDSKIIIGETINDKLEPLSFINIKISGKEGLFTSNVEGKFKVSAQSSDTLIFSAIGYIEFKIPVIMLNYEYNYITLHEQVYDLQTVDVSAYRWQDFKYEMMNKELKPMEKDIIIIKGLPNPFTKLKPISLVGSPVSFIFEYFKKENIRKRQLKRWENIYEKTYIKIK
jgi:hypothetical protein